MCTPYSPNPPSMPCEVLTQALAMNRGASTRLCTVKDQTCGFKGLAFTMEEFDDIDSDSDSLEVQDIQRLKACLESDPDSDESDSSDEPEASTSAAATNTEPKSYRARIEEALDLNKQSDDNWKRLETILQAKLFECRQKLEEINVIKSGSDCQSKNNMKFHYALCGRPYFKDKFFCSPPHNNDTITIQNAGMIDYANLSTVTGWTIKDKVDFVAIMHRTVRNNKRKEITAKINGLINDPENPLNREIKKQINTLKEELSSLDTQKLGTITTFDSIDQEYDWDSISDKLNRRHTGNECKALWKSFLHPSLNKTAWSRKEHIMLKDIAMKHNFEDWDSIAAELDTGRSGYQCFVYYRTNLNTTTCLKWTKEEDEYLKRLVNYYREGNYIPWGKVAAMMENRNKMQIYTRWRNSCQPKLKKGRFFPEEDAVLLAFVKKYGLDFHKATKYIPGRTHTQLRIRYNVIANNTTSAVWTVEEDRKLIQLMVTEHNGNSFSEVAKYFPGKDRSHVRTRYMTLKKWMLTNPNKEISWAPRKGARRLIRGHYNSDLEKAITNLNNRLESEVKQLGKKAKISKTSDMSLIDDAIIAHLINDHITEERIHSKDSVDDKEVELNDMLLTQRQLNADNLKRLLFLLKAQMNKNKFLDSFYGGMYPELLDDKVSEIKVRCYSKKTPVQSALSYSSVDIWERSNDKSNFVLPPNYSTITALKTIMAKLSLSKVNNKLHKNYSIFQLCRNSEFKHEWELLLDRFQILFTWPLIISNTPPVVQMSLFHEKEIENESKYGDRKNCE
ncbi:snRNA-activating protein complex subunit 4 [Eumeta japonica]|uniref:snRNA-activating protein complex subunit 4 n=1 Tax=Eumeta variegata TaxID=151549 RepID=A0A4C1VM12_EUMVA|nr:snRNA-activating protein complex subunit 4 [Eumeta japonica]